MKMLRVGVVGATGKMGRAIMALVHGAADMEIGSAVVSAGNALIGSDFSEIVGGKASGIAFTTGLKQVDVAIDFSRPEALKAVIDQCMEKNIALVSGTTGLSEAQFELLRQTAKQVPVLWSSNMSLGVAVLNRAVAMVARALPDKDLEIIEAHHNQKIDAPSGTALTLAREAANARGRKLEDVLHCGREGKTEKRAAGEIGISAVRAGDIVGEHTALFAWPGERIEITHRATDRGIFARGAITAARFVAGAEPGFYSMDDVF